MPAKSQTAKKVFSHEVAVVGLGFRMKRDAREMLAGMVAKRHRRVELQREQENRHDINAIRVVYAKDGPSVLSGTHLGYLRADTAALLAPLMDDGKFKFKSATLTALDKDDDWKTGTLVVEFYDRR